MVYCGAGGGKIWYTGIPTSAKKLNENLPEKYSLSQNYPNPFNQSSIINFQCSMTGIVKLMLFDITGREINTLVNEYLYPGSYSVNIDGSNLTSGVYYYKLTAGNYSEVRKMILIR
jgi:hypothetical protein